MRWVQQQALGFILMLWGNETRVPAPLTRRWIRSCSEPAEGKERDKGPGWLGLGGVAGARHPHRQIFSPPVHLLPMSFRCLMTLQRLHAPGHKPLCFPSSEA